MYLPFPRVEYRGNLTAAGEADYHDRDDLARPPWFGGGTRHSERWPELHTCVMRVPRVYGGCSEVTVKRANGGESVQARMRVPALDFMHPGC
jgi:hypothetical protein